jgi:hypothetical protein
VPGRPAEWVPGPDELLDHGTEIEIRQHDEPGMLHSGAVAVTVLRIGRDKVDGQVRHPDQRVDVLWDRPQDPHAMTPADPGPTEEPDQGCPVANRRGS